MQDGFEGFEMLGLDKSLPTRQLDFMESGGQLFRCSWVKNRHYQLSDYESYLTSEKLNFLLFKMKITTAPVQVVRTR